jgi:predicted secreted protein
MFKKILLIITISVLVMGLVACKKGTDNHQYETNHSVPDTGRVIDVTEKNNSIVFTEPGDAILITLKAEKDSGFQWSFREPISGGYLTLKRHDIITENDPRLEEGELISEWKFKIEKAAQFNILLEYEQPAVSKEPKEVFLIKIVSDKNKNEVPNIFVDTPNSDTEFLSPLKLTGFARVFEGTVNYRLKDENDNVLAEGFIQAKVGAPEFGYFEKEIEFTEPESGKGTLEVFQISAKDGSEIDKVLISLE